MQKNALVTGGNSGIGYATAKLLKQKGYEVTICGRHAERVAQAAKELGVASLVADMGNEADVQKLIALYSNKSLDALVNNAAIARFFPIEYATQKDFDEFININVRGPFDLIKGLLPALKKTKGSITNVSSAVVNNGLANASIYAITKGAIDALTKSLAIEFAPVGVRINAVSPGAIETPIIEKLGLDPATIAAIKSHVITTIPMARYGNADEVAAVIVAQLESTYTTGAVWAVDGGVDAR
jgi:NAD(P)-dependent dehydrogenase (short-subunit alcohol dehydrogenase family)